MKHPVRDWPDAPRYIDSVEYFEVIKSDIEGGNVMTWKYAPNTLLTEKKGDLCV